VSLRDALARKQPSETHYDLVIADPTAHQQRVAEADTMVSLARLRGDSDAVASAQRALTEAKAALIEECVYRVRLRNLAPDEFEALVSAHEATPEQQAKGEVWNRDTLTPHLLAASVVDGDMTADEWEVELKSDRWSAADKLGIYRAALNANIIDRSASLPKG
jgi:hypothetical protein